MIVISNEKKKTYCSRCHTEQNVGLLSSQKEGHHRRINAHPLSPCSLFVETRKSLPVVRILRRPQYFPVASKTEKQLTDKTVFLPRNGAASLWAHAHVFLPASFSLHFRCGSILSMNFTGVLLVCSFFLFQRVICMSPYLHVERFIWHT